MSVLTRRAVLRSGGISVGAGLLSMAPAQSAVAQDASSGVFHVFGFQWKQGTTEAQKQRARKEILAFQGVIPGLIQTHVGPNLSPRGKGYTFGGIMLFKDEASMNAYFQHPAHLALRDWLMPLIDAVEIDIRS